MSEHVEAIIIALLVINLAGLIVVALRVTHHTDGTRQLEGRLSKLEGRVDVLPTHRDLADLRGNLTKVAETVASINGQTQAMTQMLRTIQEHLLENDR